MKTPVKKKSVAKKYRIYFRQINQCYEIVSADCQEVAIDKAKREWRSENHPEVLEVEEL